MFFWQLATKHDCQKNLIIGHCMFAETCGKNSGPTDRKEADRWRLSKHCFTVTPACGEQYFLLDDFSGSQKGPGTECFCRAITGPLWFKQEGTELFLLTDFDPAARRLSEKATEITGGSSACFSWEVNAVCLSLTSWPTQQKRPAQPPQQLI